MPSLHVSEFAGLGATAQSDSVPCVDAGSWNADQEVSPAAGGIATFGAITAGSGYTKGVYLDVPLTGGSGSKAVADITVGTAVGQILTLGSIVGGTLYTTGTYTNVPLAYVTSGAGVGATANVTVAGGAVTAITIVNGGSGYSDADSLTVANSHLGGTGSGFHVPVATIGTGGVTAVTLVAPGTGYAVSDEPSASATILGAGGSGFTVDVATLNAVSAAFKATTAWVLLTAGAACSIAFGLNPMAAVGGWFMAAGSVLLVRVPTGLGWSVSVIADAA